MVTLHGLFCFLLPQHHDKKSYGVTTGTFHRVLPCMGCKHISRCKWGWKNSLNEGEGGEESERKTRPGDIAISIYTTITI